MFEKIRNLFKNQNDVQYFLINEKSTNLTEQRQFLISLSQIIGEHHNYYTNSLTAGTNLESYAEIMENWYKITDAETAELFIQTRLEDGFRDYYNNIIEQFTKTEGNASLLAGDGEEIEEIQSYFDNIKEVLKLSEGHFWFANNLGVTDAFDHGRIAFVIRSSYTLGYISETKAWEYLDIIGRLASEKFTTWTEYTKSYMLGRAIWGGDDGNFEDFSKVSRYLIDSPDSPWTSKFLKAY
ncbi:DUF1266 domain-containing protein [Tenacibaculum dicentrarchi]|nr:DUF1266 domain-containing protein [Tenacibaculum dicentrarchi]MCG8839045.1 DUF1266 domain-containing protein [Tenacibaculum dicentrarchi]